MAGIDWVSELGRQVGRRWFALVGALATAVSVVGFAVSEWRWWAWIAIGGLALLVISLAWTLRDTLGALKRAETSLATTPHRPPGGGTPLVPPVEYQVDALRHAVASISKSQLTFDIRELSEVMKNLPRTGTNPVYEPLGTVMCTGGIAMLVGLGELRSLRSLGGPWEIVQT